jgi:hypothetical protein
MMPGAVRERLAGLAAAPLPVPLAPVSAKWERVAASFRAPERSFGAGELRRDLTGGGFRVLDRGGLLIAPGPLRMLDVLLHLRASAGERLTGALVVPFEAIETRWHWAGRFGYLLAMQVEKAG